MLYFVATPIGNLKDISFRAIEVLSEVDVIACEDTRNSIKLLSHYNINKKLIAYHKFNEKNSADGIVELLKSGKNVAVISDSGMPVISDPGGVLINKLKQNNLPYTVVPGANAGLCALLLSGLDSTRYTFVGFLPEQNKDKKVLFEDIKKYKSTLIFYISPHSLFKDLETLYSYLGERKACLVNEITKMFEKTHTFVLGQTPEIEARGEYVLVVEGAKSEQADNSQDIKQMLKNLLDEGQKKSEAVKIIAKELGISKNEVYKLALDL
ncbi:MAG: 16S rRNA (cytidine(1402)-2'-O)-methyltransferase [Clostridia bacterium]|nr:16S rRNA (cytidine(1402)-2'-O)-methyltransferase [Clostridia bacterium]